MLANWITISRFPLLLLSIFALYHGSPLARLAGAVLVFLGLMLDTVDGVVARKAGQSSLFGSVLDIAADRTYELVLWVCFADLRMVPATIPLIVVARTTLTDAVRSLGVGRGTAPFEQHRTGLARFLVGSAWMRIGYSASKVTTFSGLALAHAFSGFPGETIMGGVAAPMIAALRVMAWLMVIICVVRGLPVVVGSLRQYWRDARLVGAMKAEGCTAPASSGEPERTPTAIYVPFTNRSKRGLPWSGAKVGSSLSKPVEMSQGILSKGSS